MADRYNSANSRASAAGPVAEAGSMADIALRAQRVVSAGLKHQVATGLVGESVISPLSVGSAFLEMAAQLAANPAQLFEMQMGFWQNYITLWQRSTYRLMGGKCVPVVAEAVDDKRFQDSCWRDNEIFDFIRQSYLLSAHFIQDVVGQVNGIDAKTVQKLTFLARQFTDAMSPSNFAFTNPQVLRKTVETGGENLIRGLSNLLHDLEAGKGRLLIKMADDSGFEIGRNIVMTPEAVIFHNDLMELIQYAPTTEKVRRRPLVIFPPWINKYYVLDLQPENSFVRGAVSQGHSVFVVSWVNPDESLAAKDFGDYMTDGVFAAFHTIEQATGERRVNAIGYCLGGTLLAATLGYMAARWDDRVVTATFLTTLTDFADVGELGIFIDEDSIRSLEERMQYKGYMEPMEMMTTFNMLRANDLIWNFVVNNYLLGSDPLPFDLLYWTSDATRMPAAMHSFYLRNMYQKNLLSASNGISLAGVPIDLHNVSVPAYFLSCREDHIAPWASPYWGTKYMGGQNRFVLAGSGHITGVVNPPQSGKYNHFVNDCLPDTPEGWLEGAIEVSGSWWPDWQRWVAIKDADKEPAPARVSGDGALRSICAAPGLYVKVRAV